MWRVIVLFMFGCACDENCVVICCTHCINEWNGVVERAGRSMRASIFAFARNALSVLRLCAYQNGKVQVPRETAKVPEQKAYKCSLGHCLPWDCSRKPSSRPQLGRQWFYWGERGKMRCLIFNSLQVNYIKLTKYTRKCYV